ncbi:uncharacterized protein AMSG_04817 [Thecamonas trahens ATCC 50062]|uniref:Uncharacterized protein n=1 Tax=Thecamonas trahens ATCC 50062 TaxID=461836 RepID=A0A0L0DAP3_THETB|nr:hypothetical protein AMSG_04817 [Thecamonas trahens ATCC 50062]KNC48368.1 hypothetical protein AMSG_04817 [Thecamonas trahens ATCC 50062]|eukprot:XP_013758488.1 hypothetical protein AMSG_04817 [Thecamonas trahens ATCC 50062]
MAKNGSHSRSSRLRSSRDVSTDHAAMRLGAPSSSLRSESAAHRVALLSGYSPPTSARSTGRARKISSSSTRHHHAGSPSKHHAGSPSKHSHHVGSPGKASRSSSSSKKLAWFCLFCDGEFVSSPSYVKIRTGCGSGSGLGSGSDSLSQDESSGWRVVSSRRSSSSSRAPLVEPPRAVTESEASGLPPGDTLCALNSAGINSSRHTPAASAAHPLVRQLRIQVRMKASGKGSRKRRKRALIPPPFSSGVIASNSLQLRPDGSFTAVKVGEGEDASRRTRTTMIAYYGYFRVDTSSERIALYTPFSHFYREGSAAMPVRSMVHHYTRVHDKLVLEAAYTEGSGGILLARVVNYLASLGDYAGSFFILPPVRPTDNEAGTALIAALSRAADTAAGISDWDAAPSELETSTSRRDSDSDDEYEYEYNEYEYDDNDDDDEYEYDGYASGGSSGRYVNDYAVFEVRNGASGPSRRRRQRRRRRGSLSSSDGVGSGSSSGSAASEYKIEYVEYTAVETTESTS